LQSGPATGLADEAAVLHFRPGLESVPIGLSPIKPALGKEAPGYGTEGQQRHPVLLAQLGHSVIAGPLVEQREADLVRDNLEAAAQHEPQVSGVGVGDTEVANQPLVLELLKVGKCVEIARVGVVPGVELQQIETIGLHSVE